MSNDNNRVLGRKGAHELTPRQLEKVTGGESTLLSVIITGPANNPDQGHDM